MALFCLGGFHGAPTKHRSCSAKNKPESVDQRENNCHLKTHTDKNVNCKYEHGLLVSIGHIVPKITGNCKFQGESLSFENTYW